MENVVIVIHLMVVVALVIVVLLQRSEGGALGIGGGGGGLMTGRGQSNMLTRATAILATIFFLTSIGLTIMANAGRSQKSIFEGQPNRPAQTAPGQTPAPAPGGSLFEQLQRREQGGQPDGTPAAPAAPAAPSSPLPAPVAPPAGGQPPQPPQQ